jgi:type IV pilus assembly protein PilM
MALGKRKNRPVVGLDIESGFIAAAEMTDNGAPTLTRAVTGTLRPGLFHDGEVVDVDGLAEQLKVFFNEGQLSKRVRLGLASQRVVLRVLELPAIEDEDELESAVRFQAQEELPMPLDQAVLDHRVLERFNAGNAVRMRVLVVAVRRDSVEHLLTAVRKAGLAPELVDLSAFAIVRALYVPSRPSLPAEPVDAEAPTEVVEAPEHEAGDNLGDHLGTMYCYVGGLTNLAIAVGPNCVFNRVLPNGFESMAAALAERKGLTLEHSRQWLKEVGLAREIENIDGEREIIEEARTILTNGARRIADEVRLSLEYYRSAVPDARPVERVVIAGPGVAIAGLPQALEAELGLAVEPRSFGKVQVSAGVLDEADGAQLTVAAGLALEEVAA